MTRAGITVEGGLFAADLVERIAQGDSGVAGQDAKSFGLDAARLSAEIQSAFSDIRQGWEFFKRRREFSHASLVTMTRESWVIPLFERLGYALRFQRAAAQIGGQSYPISHRTGEAENATPIHIVAFDQKLEERGDARRSPHALMQEYLNKSDALWGIVTNGREIRLLRNSARSSQPAYVAIDLEAIFDGNLYNEFALAYRLLHRSRLPHDGGNPNDCLPETWYHQGIEEGGRVRELLSVGVKAALETLGSGFLRHSENAALRAKIEYGAIDEARFYRELLNLIYRLLFLMVAEERQLLFVLSVGTAARHDVYLRWYGIGRLRDRADSGNADGGYCDLWEGLKETFRLFREERAAGDLALSALNGELFGVTALPDLEGRDTRLANSDLLDAVRQLSTFEEKAGRRKTGVSRRINYGGLDVEELGSIYEGLLDYNPQVTREPWRFALGAGSQRKETGSYYTPPELVRELIESALVPVIQKRLASAPTNEAKEEALLSLTICDPAAGSGHFLLAAARHVGRELAIVRSGEAEPAPETYRAALRDVIRHCLYAVDKNPLAVDLCKVALWIEGHAPGLPLSFLDHRIRCGDSLVGIFDLDVLKAGIPDNAYKPLTGDDKAVCTELRKRNKREREAPLAAFWAETDLAVLAQRFATIADMPDGSPNDVRRKAEAYRVLTETDPTATRLRHACDAWTTAFFAPRGNGRARTAPTTADVWATLNGRPNPQRAALVDELAQRFRFFHWRLEFPEVFTPRTGQQSEGTGFDVMLGNPPWDVSQFSEAEYFQSRRPDIVILVGTARKSAIEQLRESDPFVWIELLFEKRSGEALNEFYRECGRYPLTAEGKINTYSLFSETFLKLIRADGQAGMLIPTSIATDNNSRLYFGELVEGCRLKSLIAFFEVRQWFHGTDDRRSFAALTIGSRDNSRPVFAFDIRNVPELSDERRRFALTADEIALVNPTTRTCPIFRSKTDAELTTNVYRRVPVLIDDSKGPLGNPWKLDVVQNFFSTSNSSDLQLFVYAEDSDSRLEDYVAVQRGAMIDQFDHRAASYDPSRKRFVETALSRRLGEPGYTIRSDKYVPIYEPSSRLAKRGWSCGWLLVLNCVEMRYFV
ncbi:MAG: SAM-dependent DNA methyltransferase [Alphaproteobacteria bacterium]|nr:SAM-dependent DNA methyltransferase [Alphaproteobacteria bacterium]